MSKKTNTVLKIILCIILIFVVTAIIWSFFSGFFHWIYKDAKIDDAVKETHDVADFFDKSYLEYRGGKEAGVFFDEYADLEAYKDIAFHYKDEKSENRQFFFQCDHTAYALDVYYDEETFWEISERILPEITGKSIEKCFEEYGEPGNWDFDNLKTFVGYKVERENVFYQENTAVIFFDPRYNTIRYVFLHDENGVVGDAEDAVEYVLELPDNLFKKAWVFDYSDIE